VNEATGFNSSEMPMLRIPFGLKMTSVNAKNIISSVMLGTLPVFLHM
jgi:hypothetical protein